MFRPQRFSRSRRFAPLSALWACFIPLPRPGFTLQGLSPQPSHRDSSPRCPLLSLTTLASRRVAPTVQLLPSRLQGFDPGCDPLRRAKCLDLLDARSPLEFSLPRAFLWTPGRRLHVFSAHGAGCQFLRVTPAVAFSVSIGVQPALLSLVKLPVRALRPSARHRSAPRRGPIR